MKLVHFAQHKSGNPACRSSEPAPRLASHPDLVTCEPCRHTTSFASYVRTCLRKGMRLNEARR